MRTLGLGLVLVSLGLSVLGCQSPVSNEKEYRTYKVSRQNLKKTVEANGSVEMKNKVEVYAPISGRMNKLLVKEGDYVKKGQKLGMMSSSTRTTLLDMAAEKGKEERDYWRKQILPTSIFAPVSGQILKIHTEVGEKIRSSVMRISTGMLIRADVDETDLPKIHVGQPVRITFDIVDAEYMLGEVREISQNSRTVNNVNVYQIELGWPKEEEKKFPFEIRFGMSVTIFLEVEKREDVPAIPVTAVAGQANTQIQLLDVNLSPLTLTLGDIYGDWVEVVSGAKVGQVIKTPAFTNPSEKMRKIPFLTDKP